MAKTNLRVHDLIAKTAHVTIKDTTRVLLAARVVAEYLGCSLQEIADSPCPTSRPTPEQADACSEEFRMMCKLLNDSGQGKRIKELRAID